MRFWNFEFSTLTRKPYENFNFLKLFFAGYRSSGIQYKGERDRFSRTFIEPFLKENRVLALNGLLLNCMCRIDVCVESTVFSH